MILDVTKFISTDLITTGRKQLSMVETSQVMSRIGIMENGVKFDADGASDADVALGQVIVRYQILPDTAGMTAVNTHIAALKALEGKQGTLTGKERAAVEKTYTCTARCRGAVQEEITVDSGIPMTATANILVYVTMTWEMKSAWTLST